MERGSLEKLKYDSRLAGRRDWTSASDHAAYVESLPDVARKGMHADDESDDAAAEPAENGAPASAAPEIPASEPAATQAPAAPTTSEAPPASGSWGPRDEA